MRATTTSAPRAPRADSRSIATPTSSSTTRTRVPASTAGRGDETGAAGMGGSDRGHLTRKRRPARCGAGHEIQIAARGARDRARVLQAHARSALAGRRAVEDAVLLARGNARPLVAHGDLDPGRGRSRARSSPGCRAGPTRARSCRMFVSTCDASAASGSETPGQLPSTTNPTPARCASTDRASTTSCTTVATSWSRCSIDDLARRSRGGRGRARTARGPR